MSCCGSGQRSQKNKKRSARLIAPVPASIQQNQKGTALKIANAAATQAAAYIKRNPHLIHNKMM